MLAAPSLERMVREQIEARGIKDAAVLAAMRAVPRVEFVPAEARALAYEDAPVPLADGQTVSQPYIVAYMTELLGLEGHERVLEVGTGSGYQTAVLAELASEVYSIEIRQALAARASDTLARLGYGNLRLRVGDGYLGWPEAAPFDAILVSAAPPAVPQALVEQLAVGGRLVVPVGIFDQELLLVTKRVTGVHTTAMLPVRFVPMINEHGQ
jgi:protein-L-isoaspartate(D-aspartate) O-methyltransferase